MDVDVLLLEPLVDRGERPALAPEALDGVHDGVVAVRGGRGHGLRLGKQVVHFDLLDCLTVGSAKKSSTTFSTCGLKRRRSALASAAMRAAKARGNEMVLRTVGSEFGISCRALREGAGGMSQLLNRRLIHQLSDSLVSRDCLTVNGKK